MDIYTELYDPKVGRKLRQIPFGGKCDKCAEWNGHKIDCEKVDTEQLYRIAKSAQAAEEYARERADRYWKMLQQYQGKLATLKHENNKLRKANKQKNYAYALRSKRFDIHHQTIIRDEKVGEAERTVFHAWHHSEDVPRPVCVVTVNEWYLNYVEWVYVDEQYRRMGIATEVLREIEIELGKLTLDGATDEGEAFCDSYQEKYHTPTDPR